MSEIRKDPILERWVILASERSRRPHAFLETEEDKDRENCPFCEGREDMTPPEVDSFRNSGKADEPGWKIRVVPNKFPALRKDNNIIQSDIDSKKTIPGYGSHEVIIETPHHHRSMFEMSTEEIELILKMYRKRYGILGSIKGVNYIQIFKNHGRKAGGSLYHSHTQIVAMPIIPGIIKEEIQVSKESSGCPFCRELKVARDSGRVLIENSGFSVFAPYAPIAPYELSVYPVKHLSRFEKIEDSSLNMLARTLKDIFKRYGNFMGKIPFNYYIHTSPVNLKNEIFHWHLSLMPKLSVTAGFELATEIHINSISPEQTVEELSE